MKRKLTLEQIKSLPDILSKKTVKDVATEWQCSVASIYYWMKEYKRKDIDIKTPDRAKLIDKIVH